MNIQVYFSMLLLVLYILVCITLKDSVSDVRKLVV